MCCDICPKYDECDEKDALKDGCCSQCPEYGYCVEENKYTDTEKDEGKDKDDLSEDY